MSETLIIIPTYNEKENIERLISEIFRCVKEVDILVVDDNSPDGTGTIVDKIVDRDSRVSVLHRVSNKGRGFAGIDAFKEAIKRKDISYVIEMDADFSHDPEYIPHFIAEMRRNNNDVIIGSRFIKGGADIERNFFRRLFSRAANLFIRRYLCLNVKDCSSGFRCFKKDVIASLDLDLFKLRGPAIIEGILYVLSLKGYRIKEIPIALKARYKGKTKLGFVKLSKVFIDTLFLKNMFKKKEIKEIRRFGFQLALALNILGSVMFYRDRGHFVWFTGIGSLNLIFAILYPKALMPLKKILDFIILLIGRIISTVSSITIFYLIFMPIGILFRIFGRDLLHEKIDGSAASYWIKRKEGAFSKSSYERMG